MMPFGAFRARRPSCPTRWPGASRCGAPDRAQRAAGDPGGAGAPAAGAGRQALFPRRRRSRHAVPPRSAVPARTHTSRWRSMDATPPSSCESPYLDDTIEADGGQNELRTGPSRGGTSRPPPAGASIPAIHFRGNPSAALIGSSASGAKIQAEAARPARARMATGLGVRRPPGPDTARRAGQCRRRGGPRGSGGAPRSRAPRRDEVGPTMRRAPDRGRLPIAGLRSRQPLHAVAVQSWPVARYRELIVRASPGPGRADRGGARRAGGEEAGLEDFAPRPGPLPGSPSSADCPSTSRSRCSVKPASERQATRAPCTAPPPSGSPSFALFGPTWPERTGPWARDIASSNPCALRLTTRSVYSEARHIRAIDVPTVHRAVRTR